VLAWPRLSNHLTPDELGALIVAVIVVGILIPLTRDVAGRLLDRYYPDLERRWAGRVLPPDRVMFRIVPAHVTSWGL